MSFTNDPQLDGKYLGTISKDFIKIADTLKEASYQIIKQGFSDYPIFPISKYDLKVGQLLIAKSEAEIQWNYYATYLQEFVERKYIKEEKVEQFKEIYKDAEEFCCLFVVDDEFTNFVFMPYPVD